MTQPRNDKSETDVGSDDHVASSRAGEEDDGSYVGRAASDDDFGSGEDGAQARAEQT